MRHKQNKLKKHRRRYKQNHKKRVTVRSVKKISGNTIVFTERLFLERKEEEIFFILFQAEKINTPTLDFSKVKYIDIGSAIYIKAFVEFLRENNREPKISCSPKNQKMRQILQHLGIFDYQLKITYNDIRCWAVRKWHKDFKKYPGVNFGKVLYKEILPEVLKDKIPSTEFSRIASSLSELLSNCTEHAYTKQDVFTNFYLIAGEYENDIKKSNTVSFCILDYGQGFKASLKKNTLFESVINKFKEDADSNLLKEAAKGNFNADKAKNSGRGTGLPAVTESVKLIKGSLYLYSDNGSYKVKKETEEVRDRRYPVRGSIIEVILPINDEGNDDI